MAGLTVDRARFAAKAAGVALILEAEALVVAQAIEGAFSAVSMVFVLFLIAGGGYSIWVSRAKEAKIVS